MHWWRKSTRHRYVLLCLTPADYNNEASFSAKRPLSIDKNSLWGTVSFKCGFRSLINEARMHRNDVQWGDYVEDPSSNKDIQLKNLNFWSSLHAVCRCYYTWRKTHSGKYAKRTHWHVWKNIYVAAAVTSGTNNTSCASSGLPDAEELWIHLCW